MVRWFKRIALALLVLVAALVAAGQAGLLAGSPPAGLGVKGGRLAPPSSTRNSVSSQAQLYPEHPQRSYAAMDPLRFSGDPAQAMRKLEVLVGRQARTQIIEQRNDYLRAEATSRWLGFKDDMEFWMDAPAGVIHFRSASRLGREDMGVNRARMETIRAGWAP